MLEKLKENPRLVVATLITAGVIALIAGSSDNKDNVNTTDVNEETAQSQDVNSEEKTDDTIDATDTAEATSNGSVENTEPAAGPVEVVKDETNYNSTVRRGDNQTEIVRQMVNDFLDEESKSLSAEQRLYVETNLVNGLPKKDLVYVGNVVSVSIDTISETVTASAELTEAQLALWATYL